MIVKDYVHERRQRQREMFVPLRLDPGHAQVDFGEARPVIGGVEPKIHFFAMDLLYSDSCRVQAYPAEVLNSLAAAALA
jgi:transposase